MANRADFKFVATDGAPDGKFWIRADQTSGEGLAIRHC
jgi:hypothetical protein